MIWIPGWSYLRANQAQREKMLKERQKARHKKALEKRRKAKRGGKR